MGYNVSVAYFAQDQAEELDSTKEVIEILDEVATGEVRRKLRTILGSFLFQGDDVFKEVAVLSGGEKSRVALAKMLLQPSNFLIMDEPTNHLDMRSKKVLQEALQNFEGTYLIVSHDRSFLDPIVNKVLEFSHGQIKTYLGSIGDYLSKKKMEKEALVRSNQPTTSAEIKKSETHPMQSRSGSKHMKQAEGNRQKEQNKKLQPLKKQVEMIEKEIQALEGRKENLEMTLADPDLYKRGHDAKSASDEYKEVQRMLEEKYTEWSILSDKIARIEKSGQAS